MSSLRNAVKRVTHKERAQPRARAKLGILEKKKDYQVRSKDYHSKEDRIKSMRRKASERNPEEFYFGMHRSHVKDGRHQKTQEAVTMELNQTMGPDAVRIMKDQDLSYVRMQLQKDSKKLERMQASLQFIGGEGDHASSKTQRKHTVFVDSQEKAEKFDAAEHFGTAPEFVDRVFNRPRLETLEKQQEDNFSHFSDKQARKAARKLAKARSAAYREMDARLKRANVMEKAEAHLTTEKHVSGKGRKRKIKEAGGGMPAVYKWRRKRAK